MRRCINARFFSVKMAYFQGKITKSPTHVRLETFLLGVRKRKNAASLKARRRTKVKPRGERDWLLGGI